MIGSGDKVLHIVRIGARLSCQLHAPSTLSSSNKHFSAESGIVVKSRSAVVSIDPPLQCVKFKLPLYTQFISYVANGPKPFRLEGGEWSASHSDRFPREPRYTLKRRELGSRDGLDVLENIKFSFPIGNRTTMPLFVQSFTYSL